MQAVWEAVQSREASQPHEILQRNEGFGQVFQHKA